jgi:NAD-dependent dihydropyrimidine dehydrogenase PreA subunit
MTDHGISVSKINNYIIYYGIILLMLVPSLLFGKRIPCHYYCWITPFMVIGSKIGQALHVPQLHIQAKKEKCIECKKCNQKCPMSLDVQSMVKDGYVGSSECIQCGECVDTCPKKVLNYSMKSKR